jgi:histidinol-phosphatase (PHP family)
MDRFVPPMTADYHIHTGLCPHAEGDLRAYVERALALGLSQIGFADHLPFVAGWQPRHDPTDDWSMRLDQLEDYVTQVQGLAREYADDLRISLGIEADFIPETLVETAALLRRYPFDYVIGSIHVVGDRFGFDHPEMAKHTAAYGVDRLHLETLDLMRQAAESGLFNVAGHLDHAKKFGPPRDHEAVAAAASAALRAVSAAGMIIELNTAGLRRPVGEASPGPRLLAEAHELGIPLMLGSDAHRPDDVARDFDVAAELARRGGYETVVDPVDGFSEPLP